MNIINKLKQFHFTLRLSILQTWQNCISDHIAHGLHNRLEMQQYKINRCIQYPEYPNTKFKALLSGFVSTVLHLSSPYLSPNNFPVGVNLTIRFCSRCVLFNIKKKIVYQLILHTPASLMTALHYSSPFRAPVQLSVCRQVGAKQQDLNLEPEEESQTNLGFVYSLRKVISHLVTISLHNH